MDGIFICSGGMVNLDGVPEEIKILPLGHVHSQKGDFEVDDESIKLIVEQFKNRNVDLVIDYEHQTLKDVQAPAGGWVEKIYKGTDAIMAKVKWTDKAKEYLKNREYRYLSPVVIVRKKDRKAAGLHSVALTNTPAIDGMFAVVNSLGTDGMEENEEETGMDIKELVKLLGLPETATEEEVKSALEAAKAALGENKDDDAGSDGNEPGASPVANSVVLSLLGLSENAKTEDAAAAIMALKAGTGNNELVALKEELEKRNADDMVQTALKAGKITAAQKEWALSYALSDKDGFKAFMDKAPVVVPQGKLDLKDAPDTNNKDYDMEILKNCGISKEDYEKYYKED